MMRTQLRGEEDVGGKLKKDSQQSEVKNPRKRETAVEPREVLRPTDVFVV